MPEIRDEFSEFDETMPPDADISLDEPPKSRESDESQKEQLVPKSRLDEVIRERDRERQSREELIRALLARGGGALPDQDKGDGGDEGDLEDVDPEIAEAIKPIIEREVAKRQQEFISRYGPVLDRAAREATMSELDERVPGFKEQLYDRVRDMYNQLPPEERQKYDSDVGLEALALRAKLDILQQQTGTPGDLTAMAHAAPSNRSAGISPDRSDDEERVWSMSEEEFDKFLQRMKMRGR